MSGPKRYEPRIERTPTCHGSNLLASTMHETMEVSFIHQTGKPGRYKQNRRLQDINAHVARYSHAVRAARSGRPGLIPLHKSVAVEEDGSWSAPSLTAIESGAIIHQRTRASDSKPQIPVPRSLLAGAMDPFGSFVFGTDSNVSQLIFHWDSFILQPVGETHDSHLSGLRNEAWQMLVDSFQDICRGYAFLACAAKLRATTTKSPAIAALAEQYRHVALIDLRQRLQREGVTDDAPGCMLSLIIADLANADSDSARVHMRFLKKIIQPADGRRVSIPPGAGHILLWQDIQVATLSLKRPLLDLERWEREQSPGLWLPTSPTFRAQLEAGSQVDGDALADPYLERLFQDAKKYGMVLQSLYSDQVPLSRTNSRKLSTGLLLLCGRLLAYYLDRCEASDYFDGGVDADLANIQAAAASLTAIYWVRAMTRDEMGPVRHALDFDYSNYHAGPNLLERLGQLIQVSEAAANRLVDSYQASKPRETAIPRELRLRLWILDICAYIERSSGKTNSGTHYQDRLSALLLATGTEDRIFFQNEVIDGFLSLNSDTVLGPLWFVPIFRTAALARDEGEAPVSVRTVIKAGEDTSRWTRFAEAL